MTSRVVPFSAAAVEPTTVVVVVVGAEVVVVVVEEVELVDGTEAEVDVLEEDVGADAVVVVDGSGVTRDAVPEAGFGSAAVTRPASPSRRSHHTPPAPSALASTRRNRRRPR